MPKGPVKFYNPDELKDVFHEFDMSDVKKWDKQCDRWLDLGAYHLASKLLDIKDDDIHVDMGSGTGIMLLRLRHDSQRAVLIGAERNSMMIAFAIQNARSCNMDTQYYALSCLDRNGDGTLSRGFLLDDKQLSEIDIFSDKRPISFLQDDIRKLQILRHLLQGRKITSATFMFPGTDDSAAFEHPYSFGRFEGSYSEVVIRRKAEVMHKTRVAVYGQLSELVCPGGRFVITERLNPSVVDDDISETLRGTMGECGRFWEPTEHYLMHDVNRRDLGLECNSLDGRRMDTNDISAIVQCFTRNEVPFLIPETETTE